MSKQKELRLALVCYGGVSLAVYMHGVTKEILKLARASKAYHAIPGAEARQSASYAESDDDARHEHDSEAVYFEILKTIGRQLDLRVVVDVIAGASAGGINGVILARALAHDLSIEGLRDVWLAEADVAQLLAPERKAGRWSKWFLMPLIWGYGWTRLSPLKTNVEMRQKLSLFLRSRWFRPPFSGRRLTAVLLDGIGGMARAGEDSSLLPLGQKLELFVTVTDFFGYLRRIRIHDPAVVREREHRHNLRFEYCRWPNGDLVSDFDDDGVPALAFASRATSSFPGAFPPAQIAEMQQLMSNRGQAWHRREQFLESNFRHYRSTGANPVLTSFIDGSVLNNKPFIEAIRSIRDRPAFRQVDRRLVYIDPDPAGPPPPASGRRPGFFRTLKGSLSDIPRQEPIYDELTFIAGFNSRVRQASVMVEATRASVLALVAELAPDAFQAPLSAERVSAWRETAQVYAGREAGFVYNGYLGLRRLAALLGSAELTGRILELTPESAETEGLEETLYLWGERAIGPLPQDGPESEASSAFADTAEFLRRFDLDFRRRRVRFVIRALNQLYGRLGRDEFAELTAAHLDAIKQRLYAQLDHMRRIDAETPARGRQSPKLTQLAEPGLIAALAEPSADRRALAESHRAMLDAAMHELAEVLDLAEADQASDRMMAEISAFELPEAGRRELLGAYIGFTFWDVLTFPLANWRDLGEFDEIRVDRISPDDCVAIREGGAKAVLKGIEFGHFGAFFSRSHRENDYLWGRLHGADRLIDLLYDAARIEGAEAELDLGRLKRQAFEVILAAEKAHLGESAELIAEIEEEIAAEATTQPPSYGDVGP